MTNHANILRALVIYGICLPLAVIVGYLVTNWDSVNYQASYGTIGVLAVILIIPILLRFHHWLLIATWNISMVLFFLPGRPNLSMAMSVISFFIFIGHRTLDKRFRFLSVPEITRPLLVLTLIVFLTAEATGGIGIRAMGSDVYGGKRYLLVFGTIMGYFALTAKRIPVERAHWYLALFFLPGAISCIQDFYAYSGPLTRYFYLLFPPTLVGEAQFGVTRFGGLSSAASFLFCYMLARYGIKGIFTVSKPWRVFMFILFSFVALLGGYRSVLMVFMFLFIFQFYLEGVHHTKLLPVFVFVFVAVLTICMPLMQRFPLTVQRSFAFIPFAPIDPQIRAGTQDSSDWRLNMWKDVIPEIPRYLLVGKGYGMSVRDFGFTQDPYLNQAKAGEGYWGAIAAGDYHNGPLSVLITFGIWGMLAFIWLTIGGFRLLYNNYRYGEPALKTINTFLLAYYGVKVLMFYVVVGGFSGDLGVFLGLFGLGIGLNGGMARPQQVPKVQPAKAGGLANLLPPPKTAFSP